MSSHKLKILKEIQKEKLRCFGKYLKSRQCFFPDLLYEGAAGSNIGAWADLQSVHVIIPEDVVFSILKYVPSRVYKKQNNQELRK